MLACGIAEFAGEAILLAAFEVERCIDEGVVRPRGNAERIAGPDFAEVVAHVGLLKVQCGKAAVFVHALDVCCDGPLHDCLRRPHQWRDGQV